MSIFILFSFLTGCFGGNILVFNPTMGYSHVRFLGNIADVLARGGHNVTVLSPTFDRDIEPFGTTEPGIHKIAVDIGDKVDFSHEQISYMRPWSYPSESDRAISKLDFFYMLYCTHKMFRAILEDRQLFARLNETRFDVAVVELFSHAPLGITEVLGIPSVVASSSLGIFPSFFQVTGLPRFSSFIPDFVTTYSEEMTFLERLDTFLLSVGANFFLYFDSLWQNSLVREFYPQTQDLHQVLMTKVGLILSNVNEFTQSPRPTTHMVQAIGGASIYPAKPISEEFEEILSQRASAVLFSLGTVTDSCSMAPATVEGILSAFSDFPEVTFLWKFPICDNSTSTFSWHPNVFRLDWIPQSDLLADPRLKVFVSHGGMNSMNEAVFRGKPVISIPLFGDQFINAENSVKRGYGIVIRRENLSREALSKALRLTLDHSGSFAHKAAQMARVLRGQEEVFRREIVRRVDLLVEFGPMEHLRLPIEHLGILELYSVDCIAFLAVVSVLAGIALVKLWRWKYSTTEKEKLM